MIPVRLNARELRELEEQVEKSGLSREEFMRSLILGAQVHAKPCEHHPELLRKIAGLCNNANQLAHVANASGMASEQSVQEMLRLTKETWHLVKEVGWISEPRGRFHIIIRKGIKREDGVPSVFLRSEERRVGKECRSRWSPYH